MYVVWRLNRRSEREGERPLFRAATLSEAVLWACNLQNNEGPHILSLLEIADEAEAVPTSS